MADGKDSPPGSGIGKPLPATGSYKPVGATPSATAGKSASAREVNSHKPAENAPAGGLPSTGSYKPVGQTPSPAKRVADTAAYLAGPKGQASTKSSSTGQFKPITSPPASGSVFRAPAAKPPSGVRPRPNPTTSLTAPLQVGGTKAPSSTRAGAQWKCSSCGMALGPQSVLQGTAIILEGSLICVDCVKSGGKKRQQGPGISPKTIGLTVGAMALALGAVAVFVPGQVLVAVLVSGVLVLLAGLLGFTMSRVARLSTIAAGLAAIVFSGWGIKALQERTQSKAQIAASVSNTEEVDGDLSRDRILEAKRKIALIEDKARTAGGGTISASEQKRIDTLTARMEDWIRKNVGNLNQQEHNVLFRLCGEFGSVTTKSALKFRAVKIDGRAGSITMAADPEDVESAVASDDNDKGQMRRGPIMTGNRALDNAALVAMYLARKGDGLDTLEMKIVTAKPGGECSEFQTVTLDHDVLAALNQGNPMPFQKAFSNHLPK